MREFKLRILRGPNEERQDTYLVELLNKDDTPFYKRPKDNTIEIPIEILPVALLDGDILSVVEININSICISRINKEEVDKT